MGPIIASGNLSRSIGLTVAAGAPISFTNQTVNPIDDGISVTPGYDGFYLTPGTYYASFTTSASQVTGVPAIIGAALTLASAGPINGASYTSNTATATTITVPLNTTFTISSADTLRVVNPTSTNTTYTNSSFSVLKLA